MKVLVLTAGMGRRINQKNLIKTPKSLIKFSHLNILEYQLNMYQEIGLSKKDIYLVTGFKNHLFERYRCNTIYNSHFKKTHQVFSFLCAQETLGKYEDWIIVYGDVVFDKSLLVDLINDNNDFVVPHFTNWKNTWEQRGDTEFNDVESFQFDNTNIIREIGLKNWKRMPMGQYMGIFSLKNMEALRLINYIKTINSDQIYQLEMTNLINQYSSKKDILTFPYSGQFYELDNKVDLEILKKWAKKK